jgi:ParB/RepB/Spo0J family partition protein
MTDLREVPVSELHPHPDNPRLRIRDDVVTQIAAEITRSGFGQEHALLVRPKDGRFEILSGHHRHEAAKRTGLATVPCWVRELDDDDAFMTLILANTQGEMSPLEEGHHVAKYVERGKVGAGRGNKGGLREYARRLNKSESSLRERPLPWKEQRVAGAFVTGHLQNVRRVHARIAGRFVQLHCYGVHVLRLSASTPDDSVMTWDNKPINRDELLRLLRFDISPYSLQPLEHRTHKRVQDTLFDLLKGV